MRSFLSLIIVLSILCGAQCSAVPPQLEESFENIDEEAFKEIFNLPPVDDPEELKRRNEALKINEEEIKKVNEEYMAGNKTWFDALNEFSDLPVDEFLSAKTGDVSTDDRYGRGLLEPSPESRYDEESERYFDQFRFSRASVPASYDSRALGNVSPVKNQMNCGSCVAFASMGAVETCFKKLTGTFGDYSEQQFVDCGYGNTAFGCNGAYTHAYLTWASVSKAGLSHESQYPYLNKEPKLTCPSSLPAYNQGATVTGSKYTYAGSEELLKQMVYEHGSAVSSVASAGPFMDYKGGVFAGCSDQAKTDHAILVVGYGTENGVDYWLIKNSWSTRWGDQGFIKLKRGVGMCGIGGNVVTVTCGSVSGPTDAPKTTEKPCIDVYGNCAQLAEKYCYRSSTAESCAKSCGLCPGMTPAQSVSCYDQYSNCPDLAEKSCYKSWVSGSCKKSCGLCAGMTPVASNTCYDQYGNCPQLTAYCGQAHIKAGCKKSCKGC